MRSATSVVAATALVLLAVAMGASPARAFTDPCAALNVTECRDRAYCISNQPCMLRACRSVNVTVCNMSPLCAVAEMPTAPGGTMCYPKDCSTFTKEADCGMVAGCWWNASSSSTTAGTCLRRSCMSAGMNQTRCNDAVCLFSSNLGCNDRPCDGFRELDCNKMPRCAWSRTFGCRPHRTISMTVPLQPPPPENTNCSSFGELTCASKSWCLWHPAVAGTTNAGWCGFQSCRKIGGSTAASSCSNAPECMLDQAPTAVLCKPKPCATWTNNSAACTRWGCAISSDMKCMEPDCGRVSSPADCNPNRCALENNTCMAPPCSWYDATVCASLARCELTPNNACVDRMSTSTAAAAQTTTTKPAGGEPTTMAPGPTGTPKPAPSTTTMCGEMGEAQCRMAAGWCNWVAAASTCAYLPCRQVTVNVSTNCNLIPDCMLAETAGSTTLMCKPKMCASWFNNSAACTRWGCQYATSTMQCAEPNCPTITKAADCNPNRCVPSLTAGCAFPPCNWYDGNTCSMFADRCEFTANGCADRQHNGNGTSSPSGSPAPPGSDQPMWCYFAMKPADCAALSQCAWNANTGACMPKPCGRLTAAQCVNDRTCMYNVEERMCQESPCGRFNMTACAGIQRCRYSKELSQCIGAPCFPYPNSTWCNAVDQCQWKQAPSSTNPNGGVCDFVPCSSYANASDCPRSRCAFDKTNNQCIEPACANLNMESCTVAKCMWNQATSACVPTTCTAGTITGFCDPTKCNQMGTMCVPKSCSTFDVQSCPMDTCVLANLTCAPRGCEEMNMYTCDLGRCKHTAANSCGPKACSDYMTTDACAASAVCAWNANYKVCLPMPCSQMSKDTCNRPRCLFNDVTGRCSDTPCELLTINTCDQDRCYWKASPTSTATGGGSCADRPCSELGQKSICTLDSRCVWQEATVNANTNTTAAGTTSGSTSTTGSVGWCTAKVVDLPCAQRAAADCVFPQCSPDATGKCDVVPCRKFGNMERMCPADRCVFNLTGQGICDELPCRGMPQDLCTRAEDRCTFNANTNMCGPKACNLLSASNCDVARCTFSSTGACAAISCEMQTIQSQCPVSSYECVWMNGVCATGECMWLNTSASCGGNTKCQWIDGTTASASYCLPKRLLSTMPCQSLNERMCPLAPENRCKWMTDPAKANAGWCGMNNVDTLTPCYAFTRAGEAACPATYCQWRYDSLCMSPQCYQQTTNVTCAAAKCLWQTATDATGVTATGGSNTGGKCVDPQVMLQPCYAFALTDCPRALCNRNTTHCLAWPTSGGSGNDGSTTGSGSGSTDGSGSTPTVDPKTGLPIDDATRKCLANTDERSCKLTTASCTWVAEKAMCAPASCAFFSADSCPETRCRVANGACRAKCADGQYFCASSGTCASESSQCRTCASDQVQCLVDSSCKSSFLDCPCDPATPVRCENTRRCVSNVSACQMECPKDASFRCWDSSCAVAEAACRCPPTKPNRCSDNVTCVASMSECSRECPKTLTTVKCWNGDCATSLDACPCSPNRAFKCPIDGMCYSNASHCGCGSDTSTRCDDGRCVPAGSSCQATLAPCEANNVRCPDGTCAVSRTACACPELVKAAPSVAVAFRASTFDVTSFLAMAAVINYTVCGRDYKLDVRVQWTASYAETGEPVLNADGKPAVAWGHQINLPPRMFKANTRYLMTAVAYVNSSTTPVASTTIAVAGTAPTPEVEMMGGDARTVPAAGVSLGVRVKDAMQTSSDEIIWMCCGGLDTTACLVACPKVLDAALDAAKGMPTVNVPSTVPAGNYTIRAIYKGMTVSQQLTIQAKPTPIVEILAPRRANEDWIAFYAATKYSAPTTAWWYINGTSAGQGAALKVMQPTSWVTVIVRVCDSADSTACASATMRYIPPVKIQGTCTLSARNGEAASTWRALATELEVASTWTATSTMLKYNFVMWYNTTEGETKRVLLAPFDSELSSYAFKPPVLFRNPATQIVRIGVVARIAGETGPIAVAYCSDVAILSAETADGKTVISNQLTELRQASSVNDTRAAFAAAASVASLAGTAENRTEVNRAVLSTLRNTIAADATSTSASGSGSAATGATTTGASSNATRTERAAALQTLAALLNAQKGDANTPVQLSEQDHRDAAAVIIAALNTTDSQNAIDVKTDGPAALSAIAALRPDANVAKAAEHLSMRVASSADFGVVTRIENGNVSCAGVSRAGNDLGQAYVNDTRSSMKLPANFTLSGVDSTQVVSLSAATFERTPVGDAGLANGSRIATTVADFNVLKGGERVPVENVTAAGGIRIDLKVHVTATTNTSSLRCRYWNATRLAWVTDGVTTLGFVAATQTLQCACSHLSMFGGSEGGDVGPTAAPSTGPTAAPPTGTNGAGPTATNGGGGATGTNPAGPTATNGGGGGSTGTNPAGPTGTNGGGSTGTNAPTGTTPNGGTPGPTSPSGAAAPADDSNMDGNTVGAIVGGTIAGLFVVFAAGFLIVQSRKNAARGTGMREDDAPLTEMGNNLGGRPSYDRL